MAPQLTIMAVDSFTGKLAVVTGGGSGMGRELVRQLAAQGCSVAACDLNPDSVAVTAATAWAVAPPGVAVTGHACDVSDEAQVLRFRDELLDEHASDHVDLVFSNAGATGGSSSVKDSRQEWSAPSPSLRGDVRPSDSTSATVRNTTALVGWRHAGGDRGRAREDRAAAGAPPGRSRRSGRGADQEPGPRRRCEPPAPKPSSATWSRPRPMMSRCCCPGLTRWYSRRAPVRAVAPRARTPSTGPPPC